MISAIVNVTENWGIGLNGQLIVSIPEDLKRFREITSGHTVVLGQLTLSTFPGGRPLKNRKNVILSDDPGFAPEGAQVVRSIPELDAALQEESDEVFIIGGASVYEQMIDRCGKVYITRTYGDYEADRFFPDLDKSENWRIGDFSPLFEHEGVKFRYITYYNVLKV